MVTAFEGVRTTAYRDVVGIPTVCIGETAGVQMGDVHSLAECRALLTNRLFFMASQMEACIDNLAAVPDATYVALLSFTYNVGTGAFCRSTLVRKLNAGDLEGACNELPRWNRAGGRVIPGLTRRRLEEQVACLSGL